MLFIEGEAAVIDLPLLGTQFLAGPYTKYQQRADTSVKARGTHLSGEFRNYREPGRKMRLKAHSQQHDLQKEKDRTTPYQTKTQRKQTRLLKFWVSYQSGHCQACSLSWRSLGRRHVESVRKERERLPSLVSQPRPYQNIFVLELCWGWGSDIVHKASAFTTLPEQGELERE